MGQESPGPSPGPALRLPSVQGLYCPNVGTTHTTEHIRTDVGRAPPLVLQQVPLTHKMFPKAEVGDSYPMGPKNGRERVNTEAPEPGTLLGQAL